MGRNVTSNTDASTSLTAELYYPSSTHNLAADGSRQLKSTYPNLAAKVGDKPLLYAWDNKVVEPSTTSAHTSPLLGYQNSAGGYYGGDLQTDGTSFVYTNGFFIFHSLDGIGWKPVALFDKQLTAAAYGMAGKLKYVGGVWLCYGHGAANYGYMTSTDGVTWSKVFTARSFWDVEFDGTTWVFVTNSTTAYVGSSSQAAFSNAAVTLTVSSSCVSKVGSKFVAWSPTTSSSNNVITATTPSGAWTTTTTGNPLSRKYCRANNTLFITRPEASGTASALYSATADGATWVVSSTTVSNSASYYPATPVVWDGARYTLGEPSYGTGYTESRLWSFTTLNGSATAYTETYSATYVNQYGGHMLAYIPGKFLLLTGYFAEGLFIKPEAPTGSWSFRVMTGATWYPFLPNLTYVCVSDSDAESPKAFLGLCRQNLNGTISQCMTLFAADNSGYFNPQSYGGSYELSPSSSSTVSGLCIAGGRFGVMHGAADYSFELGTANTLKSLTSLGTSYQCMVTTGAGILLGSSWRLLNKKTGVVSSALIDSPSDGSVSVSNNGNTVVVQSGTSTTGLYVSTDGGLLFNFVPVLLNGGSLSAATVLAAVWVGHEWWLVSNTTAYRGKSLRELKTAADLSNWAYAMQPSSLSMQTTVFENGYFKIGRGIVDRVGRKHHVFAGNDSVIPLNSRYTVTQDHPNFVLASVQSYTGTGLTRNVVFDLSDTPTTTHFKVPEISASKPELLVYLAAN